MKKLLIGAITAIALTCGTLTFAATPAEAARNKTPHCVSKAEFKRIKRGMTPKRVRQITGVPGKITWSYRDWGPWASSMQDRKYKPCKPFNKYSYLSVSFDTNPKLKKWQGKYRVTSKWSYWIRN